MQFDITTDNYKDFIQRVRNQARDPNRHSHERPVLPVPPQDPQHAQYFDIELRAGGSSTVTVRIRRYDLYLIGYRMHNGQWLEFSRDDGRHLIPGSQYLGFGENYIDLGGLENLPMVGYRTLEHAINQLAVSTDSNARRSSLRAMAVMLCESVRFEKLSNIFADLIRRRVDDNFQTWMVDLIHSWGDLSDRLLRADARAINYFRLPRDSDGRDNILTREIGIITAADAALCLGILLGNFPFFSPRLTTRVLCTTNVDALGNIRGQGQPLVELFAVRINNIDGEDPGDLYGTIKVIDGLGSFYLYNRKRDDYESISPNDTASLIGPYRSISACRSFILSLDLKDRDDDPSPDDEVSKGSFGWDIFRLSTSDYYDKRLFHPVTGEYGSANVYYTIFRDAVQTKVNVVLINGDDEDPADVYGSIIARYNNYDYSTPEQKKYYQTWLFNKSRKQNIPVRPGKAIPLSRSVVALPTTSSMIIEADLWDYDGDPSPDDEIAKGTAVFPPQINGTTTNDIKGRYGLIRVTVAWSQISE